MRLTAPSLSALLGVLLLGASASAQERLILEPGVLELDPIGKAGSKTIYSNAYFSPYESLDQRLIAALNLAKPGSTVYMSYYSISYNAYPKTFKELKAKGVKVRLNLYEKEALVDYKKIDDDLIADGFDVALIPNLRSPKGQGSMHTKYTVVQTEKGPVVLTGSANLSASASLANHEHIVVVAGYSTLARKYIAEFHEQRRAAKAMKEAMTEAEFSHFNNSFADPFPDDWTSGGDDSRAKTLERALAKIDKPTRNGSKVVKTWFSPEDAAADKIRPHLVAATKTIKVAMYTFAHSLVYDLVAAAKKGIKVTVIADDHQQQMQWAEWVNVELKSHPNIRYVRVNNHLGKFSSLHHKYAIVDDEVVLGGSYNWTKNATDYNDENLIVVKSKVLAARFAQDFASMLAEYDPTGPNPVVAVPGTTTRVLFAVKIPFEIKRGTPVVVEVVDANGAKTLVELRNSRSTGENWLGSVDLPRDAAVTWQTRFGEHAGLSGTLNGATSEIHTEAEKHALKTNKGGLPQIVHGAWTGPDPTAPVDPATPVTPGN